MGHLHSVYDTDPHFQIKPDTREIINQSETKTKIMQYDHNSERFTFEIPRLVDGHDMTLCNRVEVHYINIDASTKETYSDVYEAEDVQVSPESEDVVIFSWLISQNATKFAGNLNFLVRFVCTDESATVVYAWNTDIFKAITVSNGIYNSETAITQYTDILEQWKDSLFDAGDSVMNNITTAGSTYVANIEAAEEEAVASVRNAGSTYSASITNAENAAVNKVKSAGTEQVNAVELKGAQTLEKIPEEYAELDTRVKANQAELRIKADAIVQTVLGKGILVNDASNDYIRNLKLFGKTEQPAYTGKNLLENTEVSQTVNGITFTVNKDKSVTVNGTANALSVLIFPIDLPNGEYILSGCPNGGSGDTYRMDALNSDGAKSSIDYGSSVKWTQSDTLKYDRVRIRIASGATVNNLTFYPMIRLATITDSTYEPFSGLLPSPSPQYPQPLESEGKWGNLAQYEALNYSGYNAVIPETLKDVKQITMAVKPNAGTQAINYQVTFANGTHEYDTIVPTNAENNKWYTKTRTFNSWDVKAVKIYLLDDAFYTPRTAEHMFVGVGTWNIDDNSYRPYSGQKEVESGVYGKNLWCYDTDITTTGAGSPIHMVVFKLPIGKYIWSFETVSTGITMQLNLRYSNGDIMQIVYKYVSTSGLQETEFEITEETSLVSVYFSNEGSLTNMMIRKAEITDGSYEPYTKQSHISLVGDGLKGIPVTDASLATYTDENGQMWCADYVDCNRVVNVLRTNTEILDGSDDEGWTRTTDSGTGIVRFQRVFPNCLNKFQTSLCSHFRNVNYAWANSPYGIYSDYNGGEKVKFFRQPNENVNTLAEWKAWLAENPITVTYLLETPIETPLTADELTSYKALHSNYKVTSVMNDCGAFSELKYNADTKLYIDNKFATLAAQLV